MANKSLDLESTSSQYLSITDAAQTGLDLSGDFTFESSIKFESLPAVSGSNFLISKDNTTNRSYSINSLFNNAGTYQVIVEVYGNIGTEQVRWNWTPTIDTWYHFALTYDVSQVTASAFELYIDAVSKGNGSVTTSNNNTSINNTIAPFEVGRRGDGIGYLDGKLDELRVWNDIRTSTEISNNMSKQISGSEANLVAYYRFNNTYSDETSNGNNLTANNNPVFSDDTPFKVIDTSMLMVF